MSDIYVNLLKRVPGPHEDLKKFANEEVLSDKKLPDVYYISTSAWEEMGSPEAIEVTAKAVAIEVPDVIDFPINEGENNG